jgi:hypothetical protein
MNGLLYLLGFASVGLCLGICWFQDIGVICDDPPPEEPNVLEPRVMTVSEGLDELKKERRREN